MAEEEVEDLRKEILDGLGLTEELLAEHTPTPFCALLLDFEEEERRRREFVRSKFRELCLESLKKR